MGKILADKKVIAIIVISSLLFIMASLSIVLSILLINKSKAVNHYLTVEDLIIEHDSLYGKGKIVGYTGSETRVVLPASYSIEDGKVVSGSDYKITAIGQKAFSNSGIKYVELSKNTIEIESCAFYENCSLESFKASNLLVVGEFAFSGCKNLSSVEIYSTAKVEVERFAFYNCKALEQIEFCDYVSSIGEYSFSGTALKDVYLSKTITSIGDNAFTNCEQLTSIYLPDSLEVEYGKDLFVGATSLEKIVARGDVNFGRLINSQNENIIFNTIEIYSSEETIKEGCLTNFLQLEKFILPSIVSQIQNGSFDNVKHINTLVTPAVYDLGYDFEGVENVTNFVIISSQISSEVGAYYASFSDIEIENLVISEGVTKLGEYSFSGIEGLKTLKLPSTLKEVDSTAFTGCNIERVEIVSGILDCLNSFSSANVSGYYVKAQCEQSYKEKYEQLVDKIFTIEESN